MIAQTGNRNVIILTSGITGSSVLAGFLARSGYWAGDTTYVKKKEYDTFENLELIHRNLRIFHEAGYTGDYINESSPEVFEKFESLYGKIDDEPYRQFLTKCDQHSPWIWKDPRLWLTFHFWKHLLDLDKCRFIVLTRSLNQAWLSSILRRQIVGYRAFAAQEAFIRDSVISVLNENRLPYVHVTYDSLITNPPRTIQDLNDFLKSNLCVEDLESVYTKPLYKAPRASVFNSLKALLIYIKNYSERADLKRS